MTGLTLLHNNQASKPGLWQQPFTLHGFSGCEDGSPLPSSVSSSISWERLRGLPYPHHLKLWLTPSRPPLLCYFSSIASHCLFISVSTSAISVIHKTSLTCWQPLALSALLFLNSPRFDYFIMLLHLVLMLTCFKFKQQCFYLLYFCSSLLLLLYCQ